MLSTPQGHREPNPNRARQTATPRHRGERAGTPPLPEYEAPVAPLNEVGRNALVSLLRSQALRQLKTHIQHAEMKIQESAGEVNERATDARVRLQKERDRMGRSMTEGREGGSNGDGEGGEGNREEAARLKGYEEAVREVTGKLDVSMRRAIDSEVRVDALGEVLGGLQGEIDAGGNAGGQGQRQRRRRRTRHDDGDEEEEGEDDDAGLYEASPEVEGGGEEGSLIRKLDERMAEDSAKWEGLSLTERYSKNNSYIGFYRIIHEAKHPGDDIPPLPHASTWFSHLEDPNASSTRNNSSTSPNTHSRRASRQNNRPRSASASDSDDVAIERERISLKCPLTLLPFADPVTSTKCPHSFEREAIAAMITQSTLTVPTPSASGSGSGRGRRIRAIKCPVCSEVLTANDLREDPVLLRRIRRAAAMLKRDREEEEEAELGLSGRRKRQSGIMLGSDDEAGEGVEQGVSRGGNRMEVDRVRIKQERARSRGVTEVGDGDEQDDAMGSETESETGDEEDSNSNGGSDSEE